jgi:hypothetical protein
VATSGLNIRSGPGTNFGIIARAVYNRYFEILGTSDNGWYLISSRVGPGWVSGSYIELYDTPSPQDEVAEQQIWCGAIPYGVETGLNPEDASDTNDKFYLFLVPAGTEEVQVMPPHIRDAWRGPRAALRNDQIAAFDTSNLDAYAIVLGTVGHTRGWDTQIFLEYRYSGSVCPRLNPQ